VDRGYCGHSNKSVLGCGSLKPRTVTVVGAVMTRQKTGDSATLPVAVFEGDPTLSSPGIKRVFSLEFPHA
jgi:hypothetical protein